LSSGQGQVIVGEPNPAMIRREKLAYSTFVQWARLSLVGEPNLAMIKN